VNNRQQFDEQLFENRNKAYGAFQLRNLYEKYINWSFLIAVSFFIGFFLVYFFYLQFEKNKEVEMYEMVDYRTTDFSLEKVEIPKVQTQQGAAKPQKEEVKPAIEQTITNKVKEEPVQTQETSDKGSLGDKDKGNTTTVSGKAEGETKSFSADTVGKQIYSQEIFMRVEIQAQFAGGPLAFSKFMGENIQLPPYATQNKVDGIVYVHVVINTDGSLSELKIYRGIEESINQEVLRVMRSSPKWLPARQKGNLVRQRLILPIKIKAL
jgi:periplasmic protein TonB